MKINNYYSLNNAEEGLKLIGEKKVKEKITILNLYYKSLLDFIAKRNRVPRIIEWKKTYEAQALEESLEGKISFYEINKTKLDFIESLKDKQDNLELSLNGRLKMLENYYTICEEEEKDIDLDSINYIGLQTLVEWTSSYLSNDVSIYEKSIINKITLEAKKVNCTSDIFDDSIVTKFARFQHKEFCSLEDRCEFDLIILKLCPCLTTEKIILLNEIIKKYVDCESWHITNECFYEENSICNKNRDYVDLFLSDVNTIEAEFLILRYGLMENKKESLRVIRKLLKIRSYKTLVMIMCNAFWKLKSRWPIELISEYLIERRTWSGFNSY